mgnify:CR=1 FL=1
MQASRRRVAGTPRTRSRRPARVRAGRGGEETRDATSATAPPRRLRRVLTTSDRGVPRAGSRVRRRGRFPARARRSFAGARGGGIARARRTLGGRMPPKPCMVADDWSFGGDERARDHAGAAISKIAARRRAVACAVGRGEAEVRSRGRARARGVRGRRVTACVARAGVRRAERSRGDEIAVSARPAPRASFARLPFIRGRSWTGAAGAGRRAVEFRGWVRGTV